MAEGNALPKLRRISDGTEPIPLSDRIIKKRAKDRRDWRVRAICWRVRRDAPHLKSAAFLPVLQSFGRVSIILSDAYDELRKMPSLLGEDGELRPSIETVRRLAQTQAALADKLGLTPVTLHALQANGKPVSYLDLDSLRGADETSPESQGTPSAATEAALPALDEENLDTDSIDG